MISLPIMQATFDDHVLEAQKGRISLLWCELILEDVYPPGPEGKKQKNEIVDHTSPRH